MGGKTKIERGETDPSATRLIQIAEILGVDVIYFFQESSSELQLLDQHAKYGPASQQDIEQLSMLIGSLKKEIEKIKAELALIRKPKAKK